ncbi:MAG: right-handed parallel beta-helix repeat-containing protein [Armatimonadetes bacterium]|nr:right-handed parallel beta-helix repeat-containing protein [Armatimonadota bacterium]
MTSLAVLLTFAATCAVAAADGTNQIVVVGTNTPSDADTINAAIEASPEGAEIILRGQFLITRPIRLLGNRTYRGESRTGTILKQAAGANLPVIMASSTYLDNQPWTGTPIAVRHLTIDGNYAENTASRTAGLALRSWLSVVEDVQITRMGGDGLLITNPSADGTTLKTTQVNGRVANCFIQGCRGHSINVHDPGNAVTDWTLVDCWIADSGQDAIHLDNAAGWVIERNHLYGVAGHAIYAHRLFGTSISDNYIEGFGEGEQAGTWCGIWGSLQGGPASTIANNRIFNFGGEPRAESEYRYICLTVNYGSAVVVVTGNAIVGAGTPRGIGLYYSAADGRTLTVISTGNAIERVSTPVVIEPNVTVTSGR